METRRDSFKAIADPTRRQIIGLLVRKPHTMNEIAEQFSISRQAISLQVKILEECGLIMITPHGRERICEARLEGLNEVSQWVEKYRKYWESHLDSLESYLNKLQKSKKYGNRKK
jgi:DNA-binding transcriptional ArsR family regulator